MWLSLLVLGLERRPSDERLFEITGLVVNANMSSVIKQLF